MSVEAVKLRGPVSSENAEFVGLSGTCAKCKRRLRIEQLNTEAVVHHGARRLECKDRKLCERARRRINAR